MSESFREIERKFRASQSYEAVCKDLNRIFRFAEITDFDSEDFFYNTDYGFDFIRLRSNEHWCEITGKAKDKGNNLDRLEVNVRVLPESILSALKFCRQAFGEEKTIIHKQVRVWKLRQGLEIAAYRIAEDNSVFVEVEGPSVEDVDSCTRPLLQLGYLETETRSLFEMYVEGKNG